MRWKSLFIILGTILLLNLVNSAEFGYNSVNLPKLTPATTTGGNITTFLQLTDTPSSYAGSGSLCAKVNAGETAIEFGSCAAGSDTQKTTNGFYLYNDTSTIYFNETQNNNSIDHRISLNPEGFLTSYTETDPIFLAENASLWAEAQNKYNATYDLYAHNQTPTAGSNITVNGREVSVDTSALQTWLNTIFQPLENQRLSTTNDVTFNEVNMTKTCYDNACNNFENETGRYWDGGSRYIISNGTGIIIQG